MLNINFAKTMKLFGVKYYRKLWQKFAIPTFILIVLFYSCALLIMYWDNVNNTNKDLMDKGNNLINLAVLASVEPFWSLDSKALIANGKALENDKEICNVEIGDSTGKIIFSKSKKLDSKKIIYLKKYIVKDKNKLGYVKIGISRFYREQIFLWELLRNIGQTVFLILILWGIIFFVSLIVTKPIQDLSSAVDLIADGDLRQTIYINEENHDEIGQLTKNFLKMKENLRTIINNIIFTAQEQAASTEELTAIAESILGISNQMSQTSTSIAVDTGTQSKLLLDTLQTMEGISKGSKKVSEHVKNATDISKKTYQLALQGSNQVGQSVDKIQEINSTVQKAQTIFADLVKKIEDIMDFASIINQIVEQLSLLSLNAHIEAARAGSAGKGFDVVAKEVNKLAEQSKVAARQIADISQTSHQIVENFALVINGELAVVNEGSSIALDANLALTNIVEAAQKTQELVNLITRIAQEQNESSILAVEKISQVANLAENTASGAEEATASMQSQEASINEVSKAILQMARSAENLSELTLKFKV